MLSSWLNLLVAILFKIVKQNYFLSLAILNVKPPAANRAKNAKNVVTKVLAWPVFGNPGWPSVVLVEGSSVVVVVGTSGFGTTGGVNVFVNVSPFTKVAVATNWPSPLSVTSTTNSNSLSS